MILQNCGQNLLDTCRLFESCTLGYSSRKAKQNAHLKSRAEHLLEGASQHQQAIPCPKKHAAKNGRTLFFKENKPFDGDNANKRMNDDAHCLENLEAILNL